LGNVFIDWEVSTLDERDKEERKKSTVRLDEISKI
jgi:hypothetical protein